MIHAVILDAATLGEGVTFDALAERASLTTYSLTAPDEVAPRIRDAEVVILNKVRLNESNLADAAALRLICVAATGYEPGALPAHVTDHALITWLSCTDLVAIMHGSRG